MRIVCVSFCHVFFFSEGHRVGFIQLFPLVLRGFPPARIASDVFAGGDKLLNSTAEMEAGAASPQGTTACTAYAVPFLHWCGRTGGLRRYVSTVSVLRSTPPVRPPVRPPARPHLGQTQGVTCSRIGSTTQNRAHVPPQTRWQFCHGSRSCCSILQAFLSALLWSENKPKTRKRRNPKPEQTQ